MPWNRARRLKSRGYRVGIVLAGIAFVPLIGASWYATDEVVTARNERSLIESIGADVDDMVAMSELRSKLFDERNWSSAASGLDDIGLTIEFVNTLTGIDIGRQLEDAIEDVDALVAELGLSEIANKLDEVRADPDLSVTERGYRYESLEIAVSTQADSLLADLLDVSARVRDRGVLVNALRRLEAAVAARGAVAAEFNAFFSAQFSDDAVQYEEIVGLIGYGAVRTAEYANLARVAPDGSHAKAALDEIAIAQDVAEFDAAVRGLVVDAIRGEVEAAPEDIIPVDISGTAAVFEASSVTSQLYLDLVRAAGDDVRDAAGRAGDEALDRNQRASWTLAALVLVSALIALAATRAITRPIRRLADAAQQIRDGHVGEVDVPESGPNEVREATRAITEASSQLALAERQALALAEGDLHHESLQHEGTGSLGASLQSAVRTLATSLQDREEFRERMTFEATHDGLTQLANRNASLHQIERGLTRAARSKGRLAVLFLDLDGFKDVNDQFGHRAGDHVLQQIAERLARSVRPGDHVGRLGGDEFLVIAEPVADEEEAVAIARRVYGTVVAPIRFDDVEVTIGACIGIALSDVGATDGAALLHDADLAVYRAKELGRNRIEVCDENLRAIMAERADIEQALRYAIDADELELWYQPVVTERNGFTPAGYEALVRWHRPGHGMVFPDQFIPVAERTDLILALDRWVVRRAVRQLAEWDACGLPDVPISLNISGRHLASPDFVASVVGPVLEAGIAPERLIIEVTESALLDDISTAAMKLEQVRQYGVRVAIDDFGTGYTSLAHLRNLPIDILKIDRSFTNDESAMSLVQLIIDSGHLLGASVTAEGIETEDQAVRILAMGADSLQGYLYGRPAPLAELTPDPARIAASV